MLNIVKISWTRGKMYALEQVKNAKQYRLVFLEQINMGVEVVKKSFNHIRITNTHSQVAKY